eukprot:4984271-Amphidinium_carterae.1
MAYSWSQSACKLLGLDGLLSCLDNSVLAFFSSWCPFVCKERLQEIRVPMEGIAGQVAKTGDAMQAIPRLQTNAS